MTNADTDMLLDLSRMQRAVVNRIASRQTGETPAGSMSLEDWKAAADARPGVAERSFGGRVKFIPLLNGEPLPVGDFSQENACFDLSKDAKRRAREFKAFAHNRHSELMGAM